MRVFTNERKIKRNRRLATAAFVVALAVLIGSMVIFWTVPPEAQFDLFWLSTAMLAVGMVAAVTAVRLTNDWVRRPRPEEALNESLKGLGNNYSLYHFWMPARHVLVSPQGILCLTVRVQPGRFAVRGDRWRTQANPVARLGRLFRQEQIGNPTLDAQRDAARVQVWLDRIIPDSGVEVEPVVVFISPAATFEAEDPTVPVLYADSEREPNLRGYVTALGRDRERARVTREHRRALEAAVLGSAE